jgi:hypothetical protein
MSASASAQVPDHGDALASAKPGASYRIKQLPLAIVRDRCRELGLEEGEVVRCADNRTWLLQLERTDGRMVGLERDYARFVAVELVDGQGSAWHAQPRAVGGRRHTAFAPPSLWVVMSLGGPDRA